MDARNVISRRNLVAGWIGAAALFALPASLGAADGCCRPDITGFWSCGYWKSHCTTHHGQLRARIRCCDDGHYRCTFSGTFFGVIPFRYTATLTVTGVGDGVIYFRSSRNIPLFGGQFSMCGNATACKFSARYTSPKDRGVFVMTR